MASEIAIYTLNSFLGNMNIYSADTKINFAGFSYTNKEINW